MRKRQSRLEIPEIRRMVVCVFPRIALAVLSLATVAMADVAPRVLILANRDDGESLAVARHYAERRGLPESAIVALPMPLTEQITWPEFVASIWNPLLRRAIEREDIDAIQMNLKDEIGRIKIAPSGHRLDALVICRGVPLRIAHDQSTYEATTNPLTANSSMRTTEGAVDSELALLAVNCPPVAAFVPNPVYNAKPENLKTTLREVIPVGRLDGPTVEDAKALVDRALTAERDGLAGRAYVDIGGPYRQGDDWLNATVPQIESLGFEVEVDKAKGTFASTARFDAPVLYFGWYTGNINGPFLAPDFRFPPGAIALHIHSFSAATLRSPRRGWTGPLVEKGVTATFGNVGEPYLQFTHQPHLLLRALIDGDNLGVAALRSINALSWKAIVVGDPLYRPFAVSAEHQWKQRDKLDVATERYSRIRQMRMLVARGDTEGALSLGMEGMLKAPSLPLALTLSELQLRAGDAAAARRTLGVFGALRQWRPADRALVIAAARAFQAAGEPQEGVRLFERLLSDESLPKEWKLVALKDGAELARAAHDFTRSGRWDAEYGRLTAPPPETAPGATQSEPAPKTGPSKPEPSKSPARK